VPYPAWTDLSSSIRLTWTLRQVRAAEATACTALASVPR